MSDVKTFTTADLAAHSSKNSLYLAVGGKVYDCTDFIDEVLFFSLTSCCSSFHLLSHMKKGKVVVPDVLDQTRFIFEAPTNSLDLGLLLRKKVNNNNFGRIMEDDEENQDYSAQQ